MKIEHIAIYTSQIEEMKSLYTTYFKAISGNKYVNSKKGFMSYFLHFESGCRLELMQMEGVNDSSITEGFCGIAHFAISTGSKMNVDSLTQILREDGYSVVGEPRKTGDGYYESVILDPDGNQIEITV